MQYKKATFTTDTTKSDIFRVTELETVIENEDYIEKEFMLERVEKTKTGLLCVLGKGEKTSTP